MKKLTLFIILFTSIIEVKSQHFSYEPSFISNDMIWNPASTAERDYLEYGVFYRQQWSGFQGAPRTIMAHIEYPFLYNNMSVGGYFYGDRSGIIDFFKAGLNYAYKIKLGLLRHDQLSIGLSANISQFRITSNRIVSNRPNDQVIMSLNGTSIKPDADFGIFYISNTRVNVNRSYWYIGMSVNSMINGIDLFRQNDASMSINANLHANLQAGISQLIPVGRFESMAWTSFTTDASYRIGGSVGVEFYDAIYTGLIGATDGSLGIKLGTNIHSDLFADGFLKIAVTAMTNVKVESLGKTPTFEFYLAYSFRTQ